MKKLLLVLAVVGLGLTSCSKDSNEVDVAPQKKLNFFEANSGDWLGTGALPDGTSFQVGMDAGSDTTEWFVDVYANEIGQSCVIYVTSLYGPLNDARLTTNTATKLVFRDNPSNTTITYTVSGNRMTLHENYDGVIVTGSITRQGFNECSSSKALSTNSKSQHEYALLRN